MTTPADAPAGQNAVDVAAGVIVRADGQVLLAQRPPKKVYAGFWEFPGGKVESGETIHQALVRELHEELAMRVTRAYPWVTQVFTYPHATVRIHFFRVTAWDGEIVAREHSGIEWQVPGNMNLAPMLPANTPVLRALELPVEYAISNVADMGEDAFLRALDRRLADRLMLVQLREEGRSRAELRALGQRMVAAARGHGARVLVAGDIQVAQEIGADGVHLTAAQLAAMDARPPFAWVGANCHDEHELAKARELALDFVVLGPILGPSGGAGREPMGWRRFSRLIEGYPVPVLAAGGLTRGHLETAWAHGGHGVALRRAAWRDPPAN